MQTVTESPPASPDDGTQRKGRLPWLDVGRAVVLILMALDHSAYFVGKHHPSEYWGFTQPTHDSALSFLIRVATHVCAPAFFMIMGIGVVMFASRRNAAGWSESMVRRKLLVRAGLLVLINQILENPAWIVGTVIVPAEVWHFPSTIPGAETDPRMAFGVLTALGGSMAIGALLIRLNAKWLMAVGLAILALMQVFAGSLTDPMMDVSVPSRLLFLPGQSGVVLVLYPIMAWLPFALIGMGLGRLIDDGRLRPAQIGVAGAVTMVAGLTLRWLVPAASLNEAGGDWIGLLNMTKYPPSLTFALFFGGLSMVMLPACKGMRTAPTWLVGLGRAPLFFYVIHLWAFMLVGLAFPRGAEPVTIILIWLALLPPLVLASVRFDRFKRGRAPESLWRLL